MVAPRRILVAVAPEDAEDRQVDAGFMLAKEFASEVTLFSVVDERIIHIPQMRDDIEAHEQEVVAYVNRVKATIDKLIEGMPNGPTKLTSEVRVGVPYEQIVNAAEENKADLIVVGTHARTTLERYLLGSVASKVVQHAPCSVYVAR